ncbi:CpaF family protein [Methanobrevibacter olleyae]|uniref:Flagellar protein FlaI n=1 Tax=Methanobrevibacter olleyae TaxID=294671 RepID=A0A126QYK9_METOL|nr:CpaF family protein [Methanobrevibacter olleyae]AMK14749.1 type II secretion system protein E GspE [Methanobrevibacter olleyae]SFL43067.1 flagellar protein FlaI [Methanobrevibacter olleyae]
MENNFIPLYKVLKFNFSDEEELILEDLREDLIDLAISQQMSSFNEELILKDIIRFLDNRLENRFDYGYKENLAKNMLKELIGYGEISSLINDDNLEEIMVIGVNKPVFVYHRNYGMMETDLFFEDEEKIMNIIDSIARETNRRIDQQSPILDARLSNGSRVNATIPPLSANGPTITIRKFKKNPLTIVDLIKYNTLNSEIAAFLWLCVDGLGVKPANIIVSGGTSSGKTTLLNALSIFINPKERIITIEDTLELQIPHKHILRMEARTVNIENQGEITIEDLVKNSLRQRPDRIIVGEVRGKEAITLFTALNTGHSGFGTLHANNSRETITRLTNAPMNVPKIMISSIDFIIMERRIYRSDGISFRRITEIAELVGIEEGTIQLSKLFQWDSEKDEFQNLTIVSKTLEEIANLKGVNITVLNKEWENRQLVLNYLVENDISSQKDISNILENYYLNPDYVLNEICLKLN